MKKPFKFFILLNCNKQNFLYFVDHSKAILVSIYATCPNYPTIPATSPMLITLASSGTSNCNLFIHLLPSNSLDLVVAPTQQFSITLFLTPTDTCTSGTYYLFSMK